jgi:hypothetical protein
MLAMLTQAGIVTHDTGLEVHIRQEYGLPTMDPDTVHVSPAAGVEPAPIKVVHEPPVHEDEPGASNF